jgi:hypothetical protein
MRFCERFQTAAAGDATETLIKAAEPAPMEKRVMSAQARARISAAQKKRLTKRGSRRRAVHLSPLSLFAREGAADDQRARAHQRGIPATHEDAGQLAPSQDSVLLLLFGLLRRGQVKLRALVGYHDMAQVKKAA